MQELNSIQEIEDLINNSEMTLIYFTGTSCGACEEIRVKVEKILAAYPKMTAGFINGDKHLEIAERFHILSVPQLFVYVYQKQTIHEGKYFDLLEFEGKINRYYEMVF